MRLPESTKRPILYIATAVLLTGGIFYVYKQGEVPAPNAAALATTTQGQVAGDVAQTLVPESKESAVPRASGQPSAALAPEPGVTAMAAPAPASAPEPEKPKPKVQTYVVVEGDTVSTIAERFGLKTTTVLWANDLSDDDYLSIGQELKIPAEDGLLYTVESGDNLWDIALDHDADMDAVIKANPEFEPGSLQPGDLLMIPGGKPARRGGAVASRSDAARGPLRQFTVWPAYGPLTDPFGWRIHPVYGTRNFHDGMDLGVPTGTPLKSVADGTVILAGWYGGYGYAVKIDHGDGIVTQYSHMSRIDVSVGQSVGVGELIGYSGNTGVSTGPHLHFMVLVGGSPTDPAAWLP